MAMPSSDIMFWNRALYKYLHIYAYIHVKSPFFLNLIYEPDIGNASPFSGVAVIAFWKRAIDLHIYIYIYELFSKT